MISSWGASPVAMPLPSLPQALSRKNIDGALLPFEVMPSIGAEKLTQHSYLLPEKQRFGTAVFMLIMNKKRFLSLPPHLQKLISQETSEKRITDISNAWQNGEELGIQAQKDSGGTVSILSQNTAETFISRFRDVSDRWIDEVNARDINGQELLKKAKNAVLHYENNP
jgi:TRAP-type C4-dicarboxylate transport system substrate-binding protein